MSETEHKIFATKYKCSACGKESESPETMAHLVGCAYIAQRTRQEIITLISHTLSKTINKHDYDTGSGWPGTAVFAIDVYNALDEKQLLT